MSKGDVTHWWDRKGPGGARVKVEAVEMKPISEARSSFEEELPVQLKKGEQEKVRAALLSHREALAREGHWS